MSQDEFLVIQKGKVMHIFLIYIFFFLKKKEKYWAKLKCEKIN